MGISGLLPFLDGFVQKVNLAHFAGQTLAVDGYSWLHKGVYCCAEDVVEGRHTLRYVEYCMKKVKMMQHYGVTPIVVLDGGALGSKEGTEVERAAKRDAARTAARLEKKLRNDEAARKHYVKAVDVTPLMARNLVLALRAAGVAYVVAPYEADAQLAYLCLTGLADGAVAEDSDLLPYGCAQVLFKLDDGGNAELIDRRTFFVGEQAHAAGPVAGCARCEGELAEPDRCERHSAGARALQRTRHIARRLFANWTHEDLLVMCILAGCDYLPSVSNVGLRTAHRLVRENRGGKGGSADIAQAAVFAIRQESRGRVPDGYALGLRKAKATFFHQRVFDCGLAGGGAACSAALRDALLTPTADRGGGGGGGGGGRRLDLFGRGGTCTHLTPLPEGLAEDLGAKLRRAAAAAAASSGGGGGGAASSSSFSHGAGGPGDDPLYFLGAELAPELALGIALGDVDPETKLPFPVAVPRVLSDAVRAAAVQHFQPSSRKTTRGGGAEGQTLHSHFSSKNSAPRRRVQRQPAPPPATFVEPGSLEMIERFRSTRSAERSSRQSGGGGGGGGLASGSDDAGGGAAGTPNGTSTGSGGSSTARVRKQFKAPRASGTCAGTTPSAAAKGSGGAHRSSLHLTPTVGKHSKFFSAPSKDPNPPPPMVANAAPSTCGADAVTAPGAAATALSSSSSPNADDGAGALPSMLEAFRRPCTTAAAATTAVVPRAEPPQSTPLRQHPQNGQQRQQSASCAVPPPPRAQSYPAAVGLDAYRFCGAAAGPRAPAAAAKALAPPEDSATRCKQPPARAEQPLQPISWNGFQQMNRGHQVTTADWRQFQQERGQQPEAKPDGLAPSPPRKKTRQPPPPPPPPPPAAAADAPLAIDCFRFQPKASRGEVPGGRQLAVVDTASPSIASSAPGQCFTPSVEPTQKVLALESPDDVPSPQ